MAIVLIGAGNGHGRVLSDKDIGSGFYVVDWASVVRVAYITRSVVVQSVWPCCGRGSVRRILCYGQLGCAGSLCVVMAWQRGLKWQGGRG